MRKIRGNVWILVAILAFFASVAIHLSAMYPMAFQELVPATVPSPWHPEWQLHNGDLTDLESNGIIYYIFRLLVFGLHPDKLGIRAVSVILSIATLGLVYATGTLALNRRAGICAAFALAVNMLFMANAAHARFYAMNTFFLMLATYALVCIEVRGQANAGLIITYFLSMLASVSTMMISAGVLLPHLLIHLNLGKKRCRAFDKPFLFSIALVCAFFAFLWKYDAFAYYRPQYLNEFGTISSYTIGSLLGNGAIAEHIFQSALFEVARNPACEGAQWYYDVFFVDVPFSNYLFYLLIATTALVLCLALLSGWGCTKRADYIDRSLASSLVGGVALLAAFLFFYSVTVRNLINSQNFSFVLSLEALALGLYMGRHMWARWLFCIALLLAPYTVFWANCLNYESCSLGMMNAAVESDARYLTNCKDPALINPLKVRTANGYELRYPEIYFVDMFDLATQLRVMWAIPEQRPYHLWLLLNDYELTHDGIIQECDYVRDAVAALNNQEPAYILVGDQRIYDTVILRLAWPRVSILNS